MWRKPLIQVGEFLKGFLTLKTLLAMYSIASGGYFVVNIIIGQEYKSPQQISGETITTFILLIIGFVFIYVFVQLFCISLLWLGNYYPNWYYFPNLELSGRVTSNKEIEMTVINRKFWQRISLRVEFYSAHNTKSPPQIKGVAPADTKELLSLDNMTGGDARVKIIGRVIEDGAILSTGNKSQEMKITEPGFYNYEVNLNGNFRGRRYGGSGKISIRITENHEVQVDD